MPNPAKGERARGVARVTDRCETGREQRAKRSQQVSRFLLCLPTRTADACSGAANDVLTDVGGPKQHDLGDGPARTAWAIVLFCHIRAGHPRPDATLPSPRFRPVTEQMRLIRRLAARENSGQVEITGLFPIARIRRRPPTSPSSSPHLDHSSETTCTRP